MVVRRVFFGFRLQQTSVSLILFSSTVCCDLCLTTTVSTHTILAVPLYKAVANFLVEVEV